MHNPGASRRGIANACPGTVNVCPGFVIASEAKQSIFPSKERMDCFVASLLAMTIESVRLHPCAEPHPSSTASAPFTASALSITVRSREPACTEMFSAKNRASVT